MDPAEHHDILVIGAGLSGINTAHLLSTHLPHRSFAILEARPLIGGTWSFFKYPGFRSDSSMSTFGFQWHPWPHESKVGSADKIAAYLESAVDAEQGLRQKIRLGHRVIGMDWKDERGTWMLDVEVRNVEDGKLLQDGKVKRLAMEANFIIGATGYYDYENAMEAEIPGLQDFDGQVAHPQFWPADFDARDKSIALIGSGATTVTLLPQFVGQAKRITVIQRSPSYVATIPTTSKWEQFLKGFLPLMFVHWLAWWADTLYELVITSIVLTYPRLARWALRRDMKALLPPRINADIHFNPRYPPMLQRLCLTPDGEFFEAFRHENVSIVTDTIRTVTPSTIVTTSGQEIAADTIITATGLRLQLLGGVIPIVNGMPIYPGNQFAWRGCMLESLPNQAFIFGYVTTTWTPGSDQMAKIIIKLLKHMEACGARVARPRMSGQDKDRVAAEKEEGSQLAVKITSGYIVKAADRIPKVKGKGVWYGRENLMKDTLALWFGDMAEGMEFSHFEVDKKDR